MRRAVNIVWLTLVLAANTVATTPDPMLARKHAEQLREFFPRLESSVGETRTVDYIVSTLNESGVPYSRIGFASFDSGHSFSDSIEVTIPGASSETLLVFVPLNHRSGTHVDESGVGALAAALATAQTLPPGGFQPTVRIVFLGAETRDGVYAALGIRRYLSDYYPDGPHAALYIDSSRLPPTIETGASGNVAPPWLIERTIRAVRGSGSPPIVRARLNQAHRLDLSEPNAALESLLENGIPALYLGSSAPGVRPETPSNTASQLTLLLSGWIDEFDSGIPESWDRHYLYFQLGNSPLIIDEQFFVIILITAILITAMYALVARRRFRRYIRTIGRNIWNVPLLFLIAYLFLAATTYLINLFLLARNFPLLWQYYPRAFVTLKVALLVLSFTLFSRLLRALPFSKNGSFYSAAALLILFVDIVVFSSLNISFGFYFIWAYIWAFIFSVVASRLLKVISLLVAPYFLLIAVVDVIAVPELAFTESILLSPTGDLMLSFVTLPFLLMLIRLDFLFRHPVRGKRSIALGAVSTASAAVVLAVIAYLSVVSPFSPANPQPVAVEERVDYPSLSRTLSFTSPAAMGDLDVLFAGEEYSVENPGRRGAIESPLLPDVLTVRLSYEEFLDRDRGRLVIDAPQPLETIEIRIVSETPLLFYDASFPFTIAPNQRRGQIYVGPRPPLPLSIDFTVASGAPPGFEIEATSNVHPDPLRVIGSGIETMSKLRIITRFSQ